MYKFKTAMKRSGKLFRAFDCTAIVFYTYRREQSRRGRLQDEQDKRVLLIIISTNCWQYKKTHKYCTYICMYLKSA